MFRPGDYALLHHEAVSMHNPLYSPTINLSNMKSERILDCLSSFLRGK